MSYKDLPQKVIKWQKKRLLSVYACIHTYTLGGSFWIKAEALSEEHVKVNRVSAVQKNLVIHSQTIVTGVDIVMDVGADERLRVGGKISMFSL